MEQYIPKSALVAEIERRIKRFREEKDSVSIVKTNTYKGILSFFDTLEVKEVDLELITGWFDHITQIADDRKTANGVIMVDWAALDEIKCLAKESSEFIKTHYKAQKGEEV